MGLPNSGDLRTTINTPPNFFYLSEGGTPPTFPAPIQNPTRIPIQYQEKEGSPRTHWRPNGSEVVRILQCDWQSPGGCVDATKDLLGFPRIKMGPSGGRYISRYLPNMFPLASAGDPWTPSRLYMACTTIRNTQGLIPCADSNKDDWGVHKYQMVEIEAVWETLEYNLLSDEDMLAYGYIDSNGLPDESSLARFIIRHPQPSTSLVSLPPGSLAYASDGTAVLGNPGIQRLRVDLELKWLNVPQQAVGLRVINPDMATKVADVDYIPPIEDCLGKVNLYDFAGCRKGTLMLTAAIISPVQSPIGDRLWDLTYRFQFFPIRSNMKYTAGGLNDYVWGHNLILRPDAKREPPLAGKGIGHDEVIVKPVVPAVFSSNAILNPPLDNVNPFDYRDFKPLFRVPALLIDNP